MTLPESVRSYRAVTDEELMRGFQPSKEPYRYHYPDLLEMLGRKGLLKPYRVWHLRRLLDAAQKGYVRRQRVIEFCQETQGCGKNAPSRTC